MSPDRHKHAADQLPVKQKRRKRTKKAGHPHPKPTQHYRLNLADIPFVVGQVWLNNIVLACQSNHDKSNFMLIQTSVPDTSSANW